MSVTERPNGMELRAISREIGDLLIQGERADYELGRLIDRVQEGQMWKWWDNHGGPFSNFERWVWAVCGFRKRKARYLRSNYLALHAMHLAEDSFSRALRLGWTKLSHVLRVARNETDLLAWIDLVEGTGKDENGRDRKPMSEEDLRAAVAIELGATGNPDEDDEDDDPSAGDSHDAETGESKRPFRRATLNITFTQEEHLQAFMAAVKILRDRTDPEMGYGEVAGLMAVEYVGSALRDDEGGIVVELEEHLRRLEATWGKRLGIRFVVDDDAVADPVPVSFDTTEGEALEF